MKSLDEANAWEQTREQERKQEVRQKAIDDWVSAQMIMPLHALAEFADEPDDMNNVELAMVNAFALAAPPTRISPAILESAVIALRSKIEAIVRDAAEKRSDQIMKEANQ